MMFVGSKVDSERTLLCKRLSKVNRRPECPGKRGQEKEAEKRGFSYETTRRGVLNIGNTRSSRPGSGRDSGAQGGRDETTQCDCLAVDGFLVGALLGAALLNAFQRVGDLRMARPPGRGRGPSRRKGHGLHLCRKRGRSPVGPGLRDRPGPPSSRWS
jgi:hypothetical protein